MKVNRKIVMALTGGLLVITSLVLAKSGNIGNWWEVNDQPAPVPAEAANEVTKDPGQEALLLELSGWMKAFDSTNVNYYLEAQFTAVDKTDTAHAMVNIPYVFGKDRKRFYLRNGQTETINTEEVCVVVDHEAQRIVVMPGKTLQGGTGLPGMDPYDYIKEEGYKLRKRSVAGLSEISMLNPHHVSMKEFTVQYDSVKKAVRQVYFVQADIADPLDTKLDKWMRMEISNWSDNPPPAAMLQVKKFVTRQQDRWVATAAYQDYELMIR